MARTAAAVTVGIFAVVIFGFSHWLRQPSEPPFSHAAQVKAMPFPAERTFPSSPPSPLQPIVVPTISYPRDNNPVQTRSSFSDPGTVIKPAPAPTFPAEEQRLLNGPIKPPPKQEELHIGIALPDEPEPAVAPARAHTQHRDICARNGGYKHTFTRHRHESWRCVYPHRRARDD